MHKLYALIEAFSCHPLTHPHRKPMGNVICKLIAGQAPSEDDIGILQQGFVNQPYLDTFDLQESIEAINEIHGTNYEVK